MAEGSKLATINGKKYPERIDFPFGQGGKATFILLQPDADNLAPFYVEDNKATNALFDAFRSEMKVRDSVWKNEGPELPVLGVTLKEAEQCCRWAGGRLPSPLELDYAAGFSHRDGRSGPARGPRTAVKLTHPRPVSEDTDDISPLGVRNLGGNGREWTSGRLSVGGEEFAILRGRMYTLSTPLTYEELARERDSLNAQTQRPIVASPQTGFRIVVDLKH